MKVLHVIVGLNLGGAETILKNLIESNMNNRSSNVVVSLTSRGIIGDSLAAQGIHVHALGMSSPLDLVGTLCQLIKLIRLYRPTIVQTWMYHADMIGGIAAFIAGNCSIVWGVHSSAIPQGRFSLTYWLVRLCGVFSHFIPDRIICCANAARISHINLHYAEHKLKVIENGYNFSNFGFDSIARSTVRRQIGAKDSDLIIGVLGRFDPLKDYQNFIAASLILASKINGIKFLMVGNGNEWTNDTLCQWINSAGMTSSFYLVGQQSSFASFLSAMDIFCLSSSSEAFPNVVVEAMAIGLPCVVTRAGDAGLILDDDRFVVPIKKSDALANALLGMCMLSPYERKLIGNKNALKARGAYDIKTMRNKYFEIYSQLKNKGAI